MKTALIVISVIAFLLGCVKKRESNNKMSHDEIDTAFVLKANLIKNPQNFITKNVQNLLQLNGLGALNVPTTIKIDAKNWVNNLEQIVGRIIKIEKIDSNAVAEIRPLRSIITNYDSLRKAIKLPLEADLIEKSYKKERLGEIRFLGINSNINNNQEYRYRQAEILNLTVRDTEIDTSKVPKQYRCINSINCNYYYVLTASVNRIETSLFTLKGKKISVSDLSGFGVVQPISGKIQLSDEKRDIRRHYVLFLTLVDLKSLFDE